MNNKFLIALDLDGTLLTNEKKISERTKKVLFKAKEKGHLVCIATGRPYRASIQYYKELQLNTPIVNFNGAFIHHPTNSAFGTYHSPVDLNTAKTIIKKCEALNVKNIMVEIIDDYYLRYYDELFIKTVSLGKNPLNYGNLNMLLKEEPTTILIQPQSHQVEKLFELIKSNHANVIQQRVWQAPYNIIEIVRAGLNKAVGISKIAKFYNIPRERIIAFGDEENDLEMIEYAGIGVAMKNGVDKVKRAADVVTKSNEEDGIAEILEEHLRLT